MIYGKVAKRFSENKMAVTPLNGKVPIIKGWETTTYSSVTLEKKYDNKNIGLLCGEPSGIITADIDTPTKELEAKLYALMPDTPIMKKGKKGINFLYRFRNEETIKIHNPINTRLVEFEIISTGRQTVIPRSIHPESKLPYIWCDKHGNASSNHLLNTPIEEIPYLEPEVIAAIRKCILEHFEEDKKQILEKKASMGIAGLIGNHDKISHKDLSDYNPKTLQDIPEGYSDRSRSGSHDAVVSFMMALINKGTNKEQVIEQAMKYDQDYNVGYATNYFNCRTNKAKGNTPYEKADYYYTSSITTVTAKKKAVGEKMPTESSVVETQAAKEMDAVHNVLSNYGVHYMQGFEQIREDKKDAIILKKEGKRDFFLYDGKKWNHTEQPFLDVTYRRFNALLGLNKSHNQITAAQSKFFSYLPSVSQGKSFFTNNPFMANFNNGTLHCIEKKGKKVLVFKDHNKNDNCTNMIPLDYGTPSENKMFIDMLERMFGGDQDSIYAIQEMFGLCIMGIVNRLFFLYGVSGSGKSTLGKIIHMLIDSLNISELDPSSFTGFNMECLVNKKVNMDMDISVAKPISDGAIKKIEDGRPVRIQRKNREDINAPTAPVHIFGMNTLPKNFDSMSGAYGRRITIIRFVNSFTDNAQSYDRFYAEKVFNSCPEGILNFAIQGLQRLIDNDFKFTIPKAGQEAMDEWNAESDPVALFLCDIEDGEVEGIERTPVMQEGLNIPRKELWDIFVKWKENVGRKNSKLTRNKFYKSVESKGYSKTRKADGWSFKGIGYVNNTAPVVTDEQVNYTEY